MRKTITLAFTASVLAAVMPVAAIAGGWALTAFDSLPDDFEAGQSYTLHYTVLQHGNTPVDVGPSEVTFVDDGGRAIIFEARRLGEPGRYTVEVTLPEGGTWSWSVSQGYFTAQDMGTVVVASVPFETTVPGTDQVTGAGIDLMELLRVVLPLAAIVAAVYTLREVARPRREPTFPTDIA
jgi:YtkA-like